MKYSGPVSFFFEGDKGQAQHWQLVARQVVQQTIDLNGGTPGTRGFMFKFGDVTITTEVEVGEGWTAPKAVIYVPPKHSIKARVVVIPFEVYVKQSAYTVDDFDTQGRTKVYVAEFTMTGSLISLYYIGDTLPMGAELSDEDKANGAVVFNWNKYEKCGPYFVAGTAGMTIGEFAEPGATSACGYKYLPIFYEGNARIMGAGANNRYSALIKGNIYNNGKKVEPLPENVSGGVVVKAGLILIGHIDEEFAPGTLPWYKKEDGVWRRKTLALGDKSFTAISQSFHFTLDEEGTAHGVSFIGYSAKMLYSKAKLEIAVSPAGQVSVTNITLHKAVWDHEPEKTELIDEIEYGITAEFSNYVPIESEVIQYYNRTFALKTGAWPVLLFPFSFHSSWWPNQVENFKGTAVYGIDRVERETEENTRVYFKLQSASLDVGHEYKAQRRTAESVVVHYWEKTNQTKVSVVGGFPVFDFSENTAGMIEFSKGVFSSDFGITLDPSSYFNRECEANHRFFAQTFSLDLNKRTTVPGKSKFSFEADTLEEITSYRLFGTQAGFTKQVNAANPEVTTTHINTFRFFAPKGQFVTNYITAPPVILQITSDIWVTFGLEYTPACGIDMGNTRFVGAIFFDEQHTAIRKNITEVETKFTPDFGWAGKAQLQKEKDYYSKVTSTLTDYFDGLNSTHLVPGYLYNILCPTTRTLEVKQESDYESWYVFNTDPEYSLAVVSKLQYKGEATETTTIQIQYNENVLPYCEEVSDTIVREEKPIKREGKVTLFTDKTDPIDLSRIIYGSAINFILGPESGPMVRPPYAPYINTSVNTPLNSISALSPYGSSIVTQFFGVEHYSKMGICDGRIYSLQQDLLDLALVSGGWWMRDASGGNISSPYGNQVRSIANDTLASKINAWFVNKFPNQDYRFLGLSIYNQ